MSARLSQQEQQQITAIVARFEADTGIQAVAAVAEKADAYPDIPWKAYAMGSAIGALVAAFNPFLVQGWSHASVIALDAMLILAGGAFLAALAGSVPAFGRLFLDGIRAQGEVLQYAQSLFLDHELFKTKDRRAILVVMYRFERLAVVLADTGLAQFAPGAMRGEIASSARATLARRGVVPAFEVAFRRIKEALDRGGFVATAGAQDEIADEVLVDKRV